MTLPGAGRSLGETAAVRDEDLLTLHRELVRIPSVSGNEDAIAAWLAAFLGERGATVARIGTSLLAAHGEGPVVCLNSHLDTVPPTPDWTRDPYDVRLEDGRVHGLGSNDAKAAVAAMVAAWLRLRERAPGVRVVLALSAEEETTGRGAETLVAEMDRRGWAPAAVVVGEPTGLDVAVAQKGLLVLELIARGDACHAAHARALGAVNAVHALARDLVALEGVYLGPGHPELGPVTVEPTVLAASPVRNRLPAEATCMIDVRTNPEPPVEEIVARLRAVVAGELRVRSDRLRPCGIDAAHPLVAAALGARPGSRAIASRGLSDLVHFRGVPGIKAGPGRTERSHTADEFVLESEIVEGARFYEETVRRCAAWLAGASS